MLIVKAIPWVLHQERTCDSASYMITRSVRFFFFNFTRKYFSPLGISSWDQQGRRRGSSAVRALAAPAEDQSSVPTPRRLRPAPDSSSGESSALFWHRRALEACVNTCAQTHMLIDKIKTNLQNVNNRFSCWTLMPPVSNWYQEEWEITHKYLKKMKVLYQNQRVQSLDRISWLSFLHWFVFVFCFSAMICRSALLPAVSGSYPPLGV